MVFGGPGNPVFEAYRRAHAQLRGQQAADPAAGPPADRGLRIRLDVHAGAHELYGVHWEMLQEPGRDAPLLSNQDIWFSRFLSAQDFRLRPMSDQDEINVLIVIANPANLADMGLPALQEDAEYARAEAAIGPAAEQGARRIVIKRLASHATVYNIVSEMREHYADVVYIACHGSLNDEGAPRLLLEDEQGQASIVKGEQLIERIASISARPRLVILASCQGGGNRNAPALGAIAPRLAQAGVPSVIAMQGDITLDSMGRFMPRLFRELARHGQIDLAVAAARCEILDRHDWWMPTLYTHSRSGSLWPVRARRDNMRGRLESVVSDLRQGCCVPVLGPGLVEPLFGSTREIARRWAERYEFPLAPRNRDDLMQVAQYLAYRNNPSYVLEQLRVYMGHYIRSKYADDLPPELLTCEIREGVVDAMVSHIGKLQRERSESDVHKLLARLPVRIYVNANRDNLLHDALVAEGKTPQVQVCTWRSRGGMPMPIGPEVPPDYSPSVQHPLIFHVFGNFRYPRSLVLTEDDYFDFLTAVTRNEAVQRNGVPPMVSCALAASGLMLLGFQAEDWDFRVLFSSILNQPGQMVDSDEHTRVAIQMNPEEGRSIDPHRTCEYLERYFTKHAKLDLFWGTPQEFMTQVFRLYEQEEKASPFLVDV
jgi:hypothetical protein